MNRTNKRNLTVIQKQPITSPLINTNIITTPYEKVLSILLNIKQFISNLIKDKSQLINDIDWCIKIITSHSLYSYELKDKDVINELSKENKDFKELVDFVSEYNENVIKMNRKYNHILGDKLLEKSSIKLNRRKIQRKGSPEGNHSNLLKLMHLDNDDDKEEIKQDKENKIFDSEKPNEKKLNFSLKGKKNYVIEDSDLLQKENVKNKKNVKISQDKNIVFNTEEEIKTYNSKNIPTSQPNKHKSILKHKKKILKKDLNNGSIDELPIKKTFFDKEPEVKQSHKNKFKSSLSSSIKGKRNSISIKNIASGILMNCENNYSYMKIQNILDSENYDISKSITLKNFNIFELEKLIGYDNVLPLMGRIILENLGLLDEGILNQNKLDNFLTSISNQYKKTTLYHNSMHGADVTQSSYIYLTHSNAEKIAKTNVIDILSIIIAALGHDLGHPGLTNMFHMNDSTDIAITYNDISILENFHASLLFRTLRKSENNIFEKMSNIDYKIIRKRMISEILATDMANHGKVVSVIKSKIVLNENNEYRLNLLSGNEQTKSEEQQYLLDFIIHLADLAHNTKLFNISLRWVSLLSEEFWRQGDLEKQKNLPVSFLCDREKVNIPQSQKGFINGFIIPTFEILVSVFPSLKFTLDNANHNLKEWQKLLEEGRLTGWTPKKTKNKEKLFKSVIKSNKDYLGFNDNYTIKEVNDKEDKISENGDNSIKKKNQIQNKTDINNKTLTTKNTDLINDRKNLKFKLNRNRINKSFNSSFKNNKLFMEKIINGSKEMKRANKISEKTNKHLKVSILDDLSISNKSKKNANDIYLNSFFNLTNKNRKYINKNDIKK
jgi:hypothetical protein